MPSDPGTRPRVLDPSRVTLHFDAGAALGEGPVWNSQTGELHWVDIERHEIHTLGPDKTHSVVTLAESVGSAVPIRDGTGWIVGLRNGIAIVDRDGEVLQARPIDAERPHHRMNDGACDAAGRFWTGTMNEKAGPASDALYCIDAALRILQTVPGIGLSNGIAWSPDWSWMYHVDSAAGAIRRLAYDLESGWAGPAEVFVTIPSATGEPDGVAVDTKGGVWVAVWDGWAVRRYDETGDLDLEIRLPVARPTSCAFGGPMMSSLLITTARHGLTPSELREQPLAGGILSVEVPYTGAATGVFC